MSRSSRRVPNARRHAAAATNAANPTGTTSKTSLDVSVEVAKTYAPEPIVIAAATLATTAAARARDASAIATTTNAAPAYVGAIPMSCLPPLIAT